MKKFNLAQIRKHALDLLKSAPDGLRYSELVNAVHAAAPGTPKNSVNGGVHGLLSATDEIVRPSRGLWVHRNFADAAAIQPEAEPPTIEVSVPGKPMPVIVKEADFYAVFAKWLKEGADEVTEAMTLGGAVLKGKWGPPDVIGVYKPRKADFIKFAAEIVSAEIKIDPLQTVTAFGQACAYRLFSHKVFIVVPENMAPEDRDRLDALCVLFGIGLVVFKLDLDDPGFRVVVTPRRFEPDMFYANQLARRLHETAPEDFDRLF